MKTICTLNSRIIMSQDGDALAAMQQNAAQHPGAVASVVSDAAYAALMAVQPDDRTYAQKRTAAYPPIGDQLDALWKGGADMAAMKQQVDAVKLKYPKPV